MSIHSFRFVESESLTYVVLRYLSDLEQSDGSLVVDQSSSLDIGLGLVGDFHKVLCLRLDHGLVDVQVDSGTQVVNVGDEDVLLSGGNKLVEQPRVATHSRISAMRPSNDPEHD
jgi:hypothetical protein